MSDADDWYKSYREHGGQTYGMVWSDYNADARREANRLCPGIEMDYERITREAIARLEEREKGETNGPVA